MVHACASSAITQEVYLARLAWLTPEVMVIQLQNRDQNILDVNAVHAASGKSSLLLRECTPAGWINLHDLLTVLPSR